MTGAWKLWRKSVLHCPCLRAYQDFEPMPWWKALIIKRR